MINFKKITFISLHSFITLTWSTNNLEDNAVEPVEADTRYTVPEHSYNENFEQDLKELGKEIRKESIEKKIIEKDRALSLKIEVNPEYQEAIITPQGIAIYGKELPLDETVLNIKEHQTTIGANFYLYKAIPHQQGIWELVDINKIDFKSKKVGLVVHGHNTTSLWNALSEYWATQIQELFNWIRPLDEINKPKANTYYGLDTLINLGRMLDQDIYNKNGKPRYDYVIGYAYSSWGKIKDLSQQFTKDINNTSLKEAKYVDLFSHSMGGVMSRWALEHEGLGEWIHNCVFIASPHQGVPFYLKTGFIEITPTELIATTDLITRNLQLDEYTSDFITELTFKKSPYSHLANYHTLGGTQYKTLTWGECKEGEKPRQHDLCPGAIVQKYYNCRFGVGNVPSDGLVPLHSAHSDSLKNKSNGYHSEKYPYPLSFSLDYLTNPTNNKDDYPHAFTLPLDHRTLTGDDLEPTLFDFNKQDTSYKMVLGALRTWIQYWPD